MYNGKFHSYIRTYTAINSWLGTCSQLHGLPVHTNSFHAQREVTLMLNIRAIQFARSNHKCNRNTILIRHFLSSLVYKVVVAAQNPHQY